MTQAEKFLHKRSCWDKDGYSNAAQASNIAEIMQEYSNQQNAEYIEALKWAYDTINSQQKQIPLSKHFNTATEQGQQAWEKFSKHMIKIEDLIHDNPT